MHRPDPSGPWALDHARLTALADELVASYRGAQPFPHVVLDGLLPESMLESVVAEFPPPDDPRWKSEDLASQRKQQWRDAAQLPPTVASFIGLLQSAAFLSFLERLSGIEGLIGDAHCYHGGPHQTMHGGFLKVHSDEPMQPALMLQRRVNVIVFLNREWRSEWGAELELWDAEMTRCVQRVAPTFNRMVIFDSAAANHGHPDPATSPEDVIRQSIALYYYGSPAHPSALRGVSVSRQQVRARPGEVLGAALSVPAWRRAARKVLPSTVAERLRRAPRR